MGAAAIGIEAWREARNRLVASARFQRWAARLPLARRLAWRRAREVFDLCAGFVYSQVLYVCVRLQVLHQLARGPQTAVAVAHACALPPDNAERLLAAACALRLVERTAQGRYSLGLLGAALLGNPGALAMVEHHALLYADLADPVALLQGRAPTTRLAQFWAYACSEAPAALTSDCTDGYSALMAASQQLIADEVLDAYPLHWHDCVLDVGGGEGVFLAQALRRAPHLRAMLFDLPAVARRAALRCARAGLGARVTVHGGDFLREALPCGADLVTLVRVLHDHDDAQARALLARVREALPLGGTLLIAEPLAQTAAAPAMGEAYFGLYLLAMGRGRPRTRQQIDDLLRASGFGSAMSAATRYPLHTSVLVARRR